MICAADLREIEMSIYLSSRRTLADAAVYARQCLWWLYLTSSKRASRRTSGPVRENWNLHFDATFTGESVIQLRSSSRNLMLENSVSVGSQPMAR